MALYSNTLSEIRRQLSSAVGDLIYGQAGTTGASQGIIYAPFLWQANDYYSHHNYEVYVYEGLNIGETRRVIGWVLTSKQLEVHFDYAAACNATSKIELHRIFSEAELRIAINLSIEHIAGKYLVDIKDETIALEAGKYEYDLPLSLLYLYRVTTEDTAGGGKFYNNAIIDPRSWSIIKSFSPKLKLDKRYYKVTAGKDLRLEGHGAQPLVDTDLAVIFIPPDWLVQKAITFLPQNRIQSNALTETYRRAERNSAVVPMAHARPDSQRVVE